MQVDYVKYDDCYHEQYTEPTRYPGDMPPILRYPLMVGKETPLFASFYQDRLGTNIGKTQNKSGVSLGANEGSNNISGQV
jgi:hypothetical protein